MSSKRFTVIGRRADEAPEPAQFELDRRTALKWLASGAALTLASCGKPHEEIVPYVDKPEGLTPGVPLKYATALTLGGYARGVMAIAVDGRPIKIEGNPRHPFSFGSTDAFAEADILGLYDPARATGVSNALFPSSWEAFQGAWLGRLNRARQTGGAGFTLVTGRVVSPTELRLIGELQRALPKMTWRRYEPVDDDAEQAGARMAFGRPVTLLPRLDQARAVLSLGADPLGPGPGQIASGRAFIAGRQAEQGRFSRLYCAEPGWTLTGMNADHRLPLSPALLRNVALIVAGALGAPAVQVELPPEAIRFAHAAAADLAANRGAALVLVGRDQPPEVHALAHWINARLQAPVSAVEPADPNPDGHMASLQALAADLRAGRVETLVMLGCNPAYDAPAELGMAGAIRRAAFSVHAGLHENETSALCTWRLPLSHTLESWGDARALDGTTSLVQPLIRPLYDTRTPSEVLAVLGGSVAPSAYEFVQQTWQGRGGANFDAFWKGALTDGVIAGTARAPVSLPSPALPNVAPAKPSGGYVVALSPDPTVYDGRYAENAWLQECPKPLTHEQWGASVAISPEDAKALGVKTGDMVRLSLDGRAVEAPVRPTPGQARGVLSATLGNGRRQAGPIGTAVGWDFAPVRSAASPWTAAVEVARASGHARPPAFQSTVKLEAETPKLSPVIEVAALPALKPLDPVSDPPSLLPLQPQPDPAWAMVIDAAACIGCNACVIACQAENNVPVVGPEEVARGRDMHWLRIDAYEVGEAPEETRPAFQPVPCMHCEHAPCEPVCPVEASTHDHEGLNVQVYNRCIGTRFCESNCPYKVRRFNFYGYADSQPYKNMGDESVKAQHNPEVTVRARGVMEKCTYCVQRISAARIDAERENRPIGAHEVVTACASACPTQAIRFGDLHNPESGIAAQRAEPRHYALLSELGTRPRTTYLARLRNPNPALKGGQA